MSVLLLVWAQASNVNRTRHFYAMRSELPQAKPLHLSKQRIPPSEESRFLVCSISPCLWKTSFCIYVEPRLSLRVKKSASYPQVLVLQEGGPPLTMPATKAYGSGWSLNLSFPSLLAWLATMTQIYWLLQELLVPRVPFFHQKGWLQVLPSSDKYIWPPGISCYLTRHPTISDLWVTLWRERETREESRVF